MKLLGELSRLTRRIRNKELIVITNTPGQLRPIIRKRLKNFFIVFVGIKMSAVEYEKKYGSDLPGLVILNDGYCNDWLEDYFSNVRFTSACKLDFDFFDGSIFSSSKSLAAFFERNSFDEVPVDDEEPVPTAEQNVILAVGIDEGQKNNLREVLANFFLVYVESRKQAESISNKYTCDGILIGKNLNDSWVQEIFPIDQYFYFGEAKVIKMPRIETSSMIDLLRFIRCDRGLSVKSVFGTKTYVFGFSAWKTYLSGVFQERELIFLPPKMNSKQFNRAVLPDLVEDDEIEIFIWGYSIDLDILQELRELPNKTFFVEDGFIRSTHLGAAKTPSYSLTLDSRAPYYDASQETDLERLLATYDFDGDPSLIERARQLLEHILSEGISKYNLKSAGFSYPSGARDRVLVIGQVEDDASISYGCDSRINNNDLINFALAEKPSSQIYYKPHPDVVAGYRQQISNADELSGEFHILDGNITIHEALQGVDHVYTISSLAGFEALLRGISVTVIGSPFYSGWGLTDDRQSNERRTRKLSLLELFAAAYILYPVYFDPVKKRALEVEEVVQYLVSGRDARL